MPAGMPGGRCGGVGGAKQSLQNQGWSMVCFPASETADCFVAVLPVDGQNDVFVHAKGIHGLGS